MFAFGMPVDVYRHPEKVANAEPRISTTPSIDGKFFSHTVENVIYDPLVTQDDKQSDRQLPNVYDRIVLWMSVEQDFKTGDLVVLRDHSGQRRVFKVSGGTTNMYVSPFSGHRAGKGIYIDAYSPGRKRA